MRSYLNSQWDFLKNAVRNTTPGANPAGMAQMGFEHGVDQLWDHGAKFAGLAAAAGIGYGAYSWAKGNREGGGVVGGLASPLIGSAAGAGAGLMLARRMGLSKFGAAGLGVGGGLTGGIVGTVIGAGITSAGYGKGFGKGAAMAALGVGAVAAAPFVAARFARGAFGAAGGVGGIALGAIHAGTGLVGSLGKLLRGLELGARTVLTGGTKGVQGPLDAWFPNFRNLGHIAEHSDLGAFRAAMGKGKTIAEAAKIAHHPAMPDIRKFAPNPRIIRRTVGIAAAAAYGGMALEQMSPQAAPPTAFFDGRYMRHINDMGANANYGNAVLGANSGLNLDYNTIARQAMLLF